MELVELPPIEIPRMPPIGSNHPKPLTHLCLLELVKTPDRLTNLNQLENYCPIYLNVPIKKKPGLPATAYLEEVNYGSANPENSG